MQSNVTLLAEKQKPLEERLGQIMRDTLACLTTLEKQRQQMQQPLPVAHRRLGEAYAVVLGGAMFILLIGCGILRRRESDSSWQLLFPEIHMPARFGAAFGSRVTGIQRPS